MCKFPSNRRCGGKRSRLGSGSIAHRWRPNTSDRLGRPRTAEAVGNPRWLIVKQSIDKSTEGAISVLIAAGKFLIAAEKRYHPTSYDDRVCGNLSGESSWPSAR